LKGSESRVLQAVTKSSIVTSLGLGSFVAVKQSGLRRFQSEEGDWNERSNSLRVGFQGQWIETVLEFNGRTKKFDLTLEGMKGKRFNEREE
jgi:hypothetical protein